MNHARLHALTDGIFAIVMTLLVLELKVPVIEHASNVALWHSLQSQGVILLSYFISFAVLFIYWRAHSFAITFMAKNIDVNLLNINGIFLFFVGLVPFTTHILGQFASTSVGISVYAINVTLMGLSILAMRIYIERSAHIDSLELSAQRRRNAQIRVLTPIIFAVLAILVSIASPMIAFCLLLFAVAFNFYNNAADVTTKFILQPLGKLREKGA